MLDHAWDVPTKRPTTKELKVHIPLKHVLKLQETKILRGEQISSIVEEALVAYFEKLQKEQPPKDK